MIARVIHRDIFGPTLVSVEGYDANRVIVLAGDQIGDRVFQIGPIFAGLAIGPAQLTEIVEHRYRRFDRGRLGRFEGVQLRRIRNSQRNKTPGI